MVGWWDGDRYLTNIQISPLLGIVLIPLWDRFIIDRNYSKHLLRLYLELFFLGSVYAFSEGIWSTRAKFMVSFKVSNTTLGLVVKNIMGNSGI